LKRETGNLKLDAKPTQRELLSALKEGGYTLDGFSRKGVTLVVRLTPADDFQALDICEALGLQARCTVFAETGRSLLILSVRLPEEQGSGSPVHASIVTPHAPPHDSIVTPHVSQEAPPHD